MVDSKLIERIEGIPQKGRPMTEPTEAMKAMAQRVADECCRTAFVDMNSLQGRQRAADFRKAALAAIIETQRADAELAAWAHMVPPDGGSPTPEECELAETIAQAIRTGNHYTKDEINGN